MLRFVLSLALAVCISTAAYAKDKPAKPAKAKQTIEEQYKALNTTNDGKLTLEQFQAPVKAKVTDAAKQEKALKAAEKQFKGADKDKDGSLSLDEFKALKTPKPKKEKKPA